MALIDSDIITAVNGAGFTTLQQLQDGLTVAQAFAVAIEAAATATGKTVAQIASAFATQAVLQSQGVAIQAQIANASAARDAATTTANAGIATLQTELNSVNAQYAAAVAAANPPA